MKGFLFAVFLSLGTACPAAVQWQTDLPTALKQAAEEKKAVLVDFTGSDWCGWCMKLKREVFDQRDFQKFAEDNLVLVEIDFPRKSQPAALKNANKALAQQFGIQGYPTIFILNPNGDTLLKTGYLNGGAKNYVKHIMSARGFEWHDPNAKPKESSDNNQTAASAPPQAKTNPFQPRTVPYEIRYDDLALKGISAGTRKTAMINNRTFAEHETGAVKLGDKLVPIECKEIREKSVLIQIEGESEPRELKLKDPSEKQANKKS